MAMMRRFRVLMVLVGMSIYAAAQGTPPSQPEPNPAPVPGFGQNAPVLNPENPPVTGLDEPALELHTATRSFFSPALQVSESADTNGGNQIGGSRSQSITRILGAFDLQQFWPKSDLFIEYLGGGAFYGSPFDAKQLQALGLEGVTRWRTGQVTVRDAFSYVPDGSFQLGTYGGVPGFGLATGGVSTGMQGGSLPGTNPFNSGQLGSIGNIPRLSNMAIADAVQAINPRSALTVAGGFSNAHFSDPTHVLINSDQVTVEAGYSHLLSRHDQIGAIYAFQLFQFPEASGGQIYTHTMNVRWSHSITGRLSLIAGIGPQYTELQQGGNVTHWSASGRFQVRYKWGRGSMIAAYEKFTSEGSGFFAGADTQAVRLGYRRPLGRTWDFYTDLAYSHNKKLQSLALLGVNATTYNEGSAGMVFRKHLGRTYDFFGAYRFTEVAFDVPVCIVGSCGRLDRRHIASIGMEWHPTPTRIE
jgi:hypothetical protein